MSIFLRGIIIQDPIPIMVACHQCKNDSRIRLLNFEEVLQFCLTRTKRLITELKREISKSYCVKGDSKVLAGILNSYENKLKRVKNIVSRINHLMRELNAQYNQQRQEKLAIEFENNPK